MKPKESLWYDAGYKTARKETIDKVLEIFDVLQGKMRFHKPSEGVLQDIALAQFDVMGLKGGELE